MKKNDGVLYLEGKSPDDSLFFEGRLMGKKISLSEFGSENQSGFGEIVFNTSMTGYQEILTDPSYFGEIVCMTQPHIGNTGVNSIDVESTRPWCAGFLVGELSRMTSSWRAEKGLPEYLEENGIPGLSGVDTRHLTKTLRSGGVKRGVILPKSEKNHAKSLLDRLPKFEGRDLVQFVSTKEPYTWNSQTKSYSFHVVAVDFGVKLNSLRCLERLGAKVTIVPAKTTAEAILSYKPDGVYLSNGPGDPSTISYGIQTTKDLLGKVPLFGICMGHQILAQAMGATTYKLKFGHRGGNQPVLDKLTKKVEISTQNHGYAVDPKGLPKNVEITHTNLNDGTIEGIQVNDLKAFSVQYHPEACPGPHDSMLLFERFAKLMRTGELNVQ